MKDPEAVLAQLVKIERHRAKQAELLGQLRQTIFRKKALRAGKRSVDEYERFVRDQEAAFWARVNQGEP